MGGFRKENVGSFISKYSIDTYELIDWKRRAASKSIGSCARPIGIGEEVNERVIHRFFSLLQLNQLAIDSCFLSFLSWTDRDGTERNRTPPAWSRTHLRNLARVLTLDPAALQFVAGLPCNSPMTNQLL
jgi:hypothetical protein